MGWFQILSLVIAGIPVLIELIKIVEAIIQGVGQGAVKKETVLAGMEQFWKSALATGVGEKVFSIPWESVKGIISVLIDVVVVVLNVTGVFKKESTPATPPA